ncbi:MAG: SIMPL domain-containing protein [Acidobacteria bacterium]|nr:SIMPL domain-containing protein [Acidobacteriota bacterium]
MKQFVLLLFASGYLLAQAQPINTRMPYLRATGEGSATARPDQAKLTLGVTTQGLTAADASEKNADLSSKVQAELKKVLGANGKIRTNGFNLSPNYRSGAQGQNPTIAGYNANNSVEATVDDITLVGKLIDAGIKAGANNVHGIQFLLKDPSPLRAEALKEATRRARAEAEAMAQGLGGRAGRVLSASDSGASSNPPVMPMARMAMMAATPVEAGTLEITAVVTVEVEFINGN